MRILVAEDNVVNQKVILHVLKKMGHQVNVVSNGNEAIKALSSSYYDLILMDIQMPEMDGFETTKHIRNARSSVYNHQIPIIALTASALKGDSARCIEVGMNDYITKPFKPLMLAEKIRVWCPCDKSDSIGHSGEKDIDNTLL